MCICNVGACIYRLQGKEKGSGPEHSHNTPQVNLNTSYSVTSLHGIIFTLVCVIHTLASGRLIIRLIHTRYSLVLRVEHKYSKNTHNNAFINGHKDIYCSYANVVV